MPIFFLLSLQITFSIHPSKGYNEESRCCVTDNAHFREEVQSAELSTSEYFHFLVGRFMHKFQSDTTLTSPHWAVAGDRTKYPAEYRIAFSTVSVTLFRLGPVCAGRLEVLVNTSSDLIFFLFILQWHCVQHPRGIAVCLVMTG